MLLLYGKRIKNKGIKMKKRDARETIAERIQTDPAFAQALPL